MYTERVELYKQIEEFTDSKVISFVTGDRPNLPIQIAPDAFEHFSDHLDTIGVTQRISLVLYSRGGNVLAGWSIVNLIKQFCDELVVIVPSKAHSTATLITLGADKVYMTKQATLGPIDPSINGPLNPQPPGHHPQARVPVSVESITGYFEFAKEVGVKRDEDIAKLVLDLASKIHPIALGDVYRSRTQIRMLSRKLLCSHMTDSKQIDKTIDFLCSESGSHDYTINRREAKHELGLNIQKPNGAQYEIIRSLHKNYTEHLNLLRPYDPNQELGHESTKEYTLVRGLLESVAGGSTQFQSKGILRRHQIDQPGAPMQTSIEDERTFEGWIHVTN